jgi:dienelactone hydrolase
MKRSLAFLLIALTLAPALPADAGRQSLDVPVTEPQPSTLSAELYTPDSAGPHPAVILHHGCNGIGQNVKSWALWLQAQGYAALVVDSFTPRGITTLCGFPQPLMGDVRAHDVYAAAARLKAVAEIDATRIAAMGFSHGGWTIIEAWRMTDRYPDTKLKALIALYPSCGRGLPPADAPPLLMLLGGLDDWTPPEACVKLAETARKVGRTVSDVVYKDARHAFDASAIRGRAYVQVARGGKGATIEYNARAHDDAQKQVKQFLRQYLAP